MRVLITGGSGFLGSAAALHLLAAGHELALLLRPGSSLARLGPAASRIRLGRCSSDADIGNFVRAVQPQAVLHTACCYGRQGETALQLLDANLRFGMQVLLAQQALGALPGGCSHFINIGSALAQQVSAYALSKAQFAQWGGLTARTGGPRFTNVLLQHMYGPGDDGHKFSSLVLRACRSHQPSLALTAGEQRRDFIHVDDVVSALALLLQMPAGRVDGAVDGAVDAGVDAELAAGVHVHAADPLRRHQAVAEIELGSGQAPTVREFVETVHALTASRTRLLFGALPYRPGEAMHCQANISRLTGWGWAPRHTLRSGLQDTLKRDTPA